MKKPHVVGSRRSRLACCRRIVSGLVGPAAHAQPAVFQAAGPDAASIQSTVDAYRAALGNPDNGNDPGRSPAVAARSTGTAAV